MAAIDLSGFLYFMPLFSFLFIFVVVFSILTKTKILGENKFVNLLISFVLAIIFSTNVGTREYIETITPWVVVFVICLFFILLIIGMSQKKVDDFMKPGFVWIFILILIVMFLIAANNIFSSVMNPFWENLYEKITTQEKVYGSLLLIIIAAIVSWVLAKGK